MSTMLIDTMALTAIAAAFFETCMGLLGLLLPTILDIPVQYADLGDGPYNYVQHV